MRCHERDISIITGIIGIYLVLNVPRHCPVVLPVKIGFRVVKALGTVGFVTG